MSGVPARLEILAAISGLSCWVALGLTARWKPAFHLWWNIEGIPVEETRGIYGGSNDDDNSGVLRYVSIRHGGDVIGRDVAPAPGRNDSAKRIFDSFEFLPNSAETGRRLDQLFSCVFQTPAFHVLALI